MAGEGLEGTFSSSEETSVEELEREAAEPLEFVSEREEFE